MPAPPIRQKESARDLKGYLRKNIVSIGVPYWFQKAILNMRLDSDDCGFIHGKQVNLLGDYFQPILKNSSQVGIISPGRGKKKSMVETNT